MIAVNRVEGRTDPHLNHVAARHADRDRIRLAEHDAIQLYIGRLEFVHIIAAGSSVENAESDAMGGSDRLDLGNKKQSCGIDNRLCHFHHSRWCIAIDTRPKLEHRSIVLAGEERNQLVGARSAQRQELAASVRSDPFFAAVHITDCNAKRRQSRILTRTTRDHHADKHPSVAAGGIVDTARHSTGNGWRIGRDHRSIGKQGERGACRGRERSQLTIFRFPGARESKAAIHCVNVGCWSIGVEQIKRNLFGGCQAPNR